MCSRGNNCCRKLGHQRLFVGEKRINYQTLEEEDHRSKEIIIQCMRLVIRDLNFIILFGASSCPTLWLF